MYEDYDIDEEYNSYSRLRASREKAELLASLQQRRSGQYDKQQVQQVSEKKSSEKIANIQYLKREHELLKAELHRLHAADGEYRRMLGKYMDNDKSRALSPAPEPTAARVTQAIKISPLKFQPAFQEISPPPPEPKTYSYSSESQYYEEEPPQEFTTSSAEMTVSDSEFEEDPYEKVIYQEQDFSEDDENLDEYYGLPDTSIKQNPGPPSPPRQLAEPAKASPSPMRTGTQTPTIQKRDLSQSLLRIPKQVQYYSEPSESSSENSEQSVEIQTAVTEPPQLTIPAPQVVVQPQVITQPIPQQVVVQQPYPVMQPYYMPYPQMPQPMMMPPPQMQSHPQMQHHPQMYYQQGYPQYMQQMPPPQNSLKSMHQQASIQVSADPAPVSRYRSKTPTPPRKREARKFSPESPVQTAQPVTPKSPAKSAEPIVKPKEPAAMPEETPVEQPEAWAMDFTENKKDVGKGKLFEARMRNRANSAQVLAKEKEVKSKEELAQIRKDLLKANKPKAKPEAFEVAIAREKSDAAIPTALIDRLRKGEKSTVSAAEMKRLTRKNYKQLPEILAAKETERKKEEVRARMQRKKDYEKQMSDIRRSKMFKR